MALRNTLVHHCTMRAAKVFVDDDLASGRRKPTGKPSRLDVVRVGMKSAQRGGFMTTFIVEWAWVLLDHPGEKLSHAAVQRASTLSSATFYRRLAEFREMFPEYDDPEPLARQLVEYAQSKDRGSMMAALVTV